MSLCSSYAYSKFHNNVITIAFHRIFGHNIAPQVVYRLECVEVPKAIATQTVYSLECVEVPGHSNTDCA